jgi:hypothetical protein
MMALNFFFQEFKKIKAKTCIMIDKAKILINFKCLQCVAVLIIFF